MRVAGNIRKIYDQEADVLYISFNRPQKATDSEMTKDGILHRYRGNELVPKNCIRCFEFFKTINNNYGL